MAAIWLRKLKSDLMEQSLVHEVKIKLEGFIVIKYITGIREKYAYMDGLKMPMINPSDANFKVTIKPHRRYEPDLIGGADDFGHHLCLNLSNGTVLDKGLGIQRMLLAIYRNGYNSKHPQAVLNADMAKLRDFRIDKCVSKYINFLPRTGGPRSRHGFAGSKVLEHYFPCPDHPPTRYRYGTLREGHRLYNRIYYTIKRMMRNDLAITTRNIYRVMASGPCRYSPLGYAAILDRLMPYRGSRGGLLDLYPSLGNKALACAILGIPYIPVENDDFRLAMEAGFGDYVGLEIGSMDKVAAVIADVNFHSDHSGAIPDAPLVLAHGDEITLSAQRGRPRARIPIRRARAHRDIDYLLVW